MGVWGGSKKRIVTTMLGILAASVTTVAVGFVPQSGIYLCVGILSATGVTLAITNAPISAILQSVVPKDMLGRVSTLVGAMAGAMTPLGLAVAGPVADAMGVRIWYLIAGGVGIAMAGGGFFMPALMNIESQKPAAVTRAVTAGAPQS